MPADPIAEVLAAMLAPGFVSATMRGARPDATPPAQELTVRPVELAAGRRLQLSAFDGTRTEVTNLDPKDAAERLAALIDSGFASVYARTLDGDLQLSWSRKGTARLARHRPTATTVDTSHDRQRSRLLRGDEPFLRATGISDASGRVKPTARAKFRQVARFVEILDHTIGGDEVRSVVDLGCGAGVLTLAAAHHLRTRGTGAVSITGIDQRAELIEDLNATVATLGWSEVTFRTGQIAEAALEVPPDLVLALHACDTATDDALARAIHWQSRWILAAPCCHHDLQTQLDAQQVPSAHEPLLRHGILRERLGDLLTDALRAEILRARGYRAEVIEFISTEHTAKNLMIRAVRTGRSDPDAERAARELADAWSVTPALARRVELS